jgi:hypothetical protein
MWSIDQFCPDLVVFGIDIVIKCYFCTLQKKCYICVCVFVGWQRGYFVSMPVLHAICFSERATCIMLFSKVQTSWPNIAGWDS